MTMFEEFGKRFQRKPDDFYGYICIGEKVPGKKKVSYFWRALTKWQSADFRKILETHPDEYEYTYIEPQTPEHRDGAIADVKDKDGKVFAVYCEHDDVVWNKKIVTRSVATCLYNACKDYMQHMYGMALDDDDRQWYSKYAEKINEHGCTQAWTLTVIQQLVEPYGLGISRVRVPKKNMRMKEHEAFMLSLGCNPSFLQDGVTTNEEWALSMGMPEDLIPMATQDFKFDCSNTPLSPAITLSVFGDTQTLNSHNGAANYCGPRGSRPSTMWVQLDRLDKIKYHRPLTLDPYKSIDDEVVEEPLITSLRGKSGKTMGEMDREVRKVNVTTTGGWSWENHREGLWTPNRKPEDDDSRSTVHIRYCGQCKRSGPTDIDLSNLLRCKTCNNILGIKPGNEAWEHGYD